MEESSRAHPVLPGNHIWPLNPHAVGVNSLIGLAIRSARGAIAFFGDGQVERCWVGATWLWVGRREDQVKATGLPQTRHRPAASSGGSSFVVVMQPTDFG